MNYAKINKHDIANGPGVRVSLFVSGCRIRCKGCFNPEAQSFDYGQPFTGQTVREILDALSPDYIEGFTVLGGEPMDPDNFWIVKPLLYVVKRHYPNKTIWVYTGYKYEDLKHHAVMERIDVLIDGPFIEAQKDISLKFRGSRNQRIIDVQASRKSDTIKLLY